LLVKVNQNNRGEGQPKQKSFADQRSPISHEDEQLFIGEPFEMDDIGLSERCDNK
jgi:hypothetical protein